MAKDKSLVQEVLDDQKRVEEKRKTAVDGIVLDIKQMLDNLNALGVNSEKQAELLGFNIEEPFFAPKPKKEVDPNAPKRGRKPGQKVLCSICKAEGREESGHTKAGHEKWLAEQPQQ